MRTENVLFHINFKHITSVFGLRFQVFNLKKFQMFNLKNKLFKKN